MINTNHPPSNRVPGAILKPKEYALDKDLQKLSKRELLDLKKRQESLLENKFRLQKLPDRGRKIEELLERTIQALELKNEIETASNLLASLNLRSNDVENLEWKDKKSQQIDELDSDDDEDPLAILTSSNSVVGNKKIVKYSKDDEKVQTLVTAEDVKEAREVSEALHLDPVLEHVCQHENMEPPTRFLPFKPKSNSLNSSTSSLSQDEHKKQRENTAATPPVHQQGVKPLTIRESLEIEHQHRLKMKELQEKQAEERLAAKMKSSRDSSETATIQSSSFMGKYRLTTSIFDDGDDEEEEEEEEADDENL